MQAAGSSWEIPSSKPALAPGTYSWWLEGPDGGEQLTGPEEFELAAHGVQEETAAFEEEMRALENSAGRTLVGFLRCTYYQEIHAWSRVVRAASRFSDVPSHEAFARRALLASGLQMGLDRASLRVLWISQEASPEEEGA
jgi:hypothetical protein